MTDIFNPISDAARQRWPGPRIARLAALCDCPRSTAASWLNGKRRMPVWAIEVLAKHLKSHAAACLASASDLEYLAGKRGRELRQRRGFEIVADWDRNGVPRDRRWRGGRRGRSASPNSRVNRAPGAV